MDNAKEEADRIFAIADIDDNGYLEFNEWCTATMDKSKMLKKPRLWAAFKMMDKDGSGSIEYEEVREVLSQYVGLSDAGDTYF